MIVENVPKAELHAIAEALGVKLTERKEKPGAPVRVFMRPVVGSRTFRAMSTGGAVKNSLCLHGQFAFMSRVFAAFPDAVLRTYLNLWNLHVFEGGALPWTLNELKERSGDTCDCTPEQIEDALRKPSELNAAAAALVAGARLL
jgi:hypothetical protein